MENLPLGRIAALVLEFAVKDLPLGRTLMTIPLQSIFFSFFILPHRPGDPIMDGSPGDVSEEPVT